jgi:hypothetical protein
MAKLSCGKCSGIKRSFKLEEICRMLLLRVYQYLLQNRIFLLSS